jgi:hypothetical protein
MQNGPDCFPTDVKSIGRDRNNVYKRRTDGRKRLVTKIAGKYLTYSGCNLVARYSDEGNECSVP